MNDLVVCIIRILPILNQGLFSDKMIVGMVEQAKTAVLQRWDCGEKGMRKTEWLALGNYFVTCQDKERLVQQIYLSIISQE